MLGLAAATFIASGIAGCEHKGKVAAQAETVKVQAQYDAFAEQVGERGKEREAETAKIEKTWKGVLDETKAQAKRDIAGRDAALAELRRRPPARPGGSQVPVTACRPEGTDAPGGEFVSLEEYRQLEGRAYIDAQRLTRLQAWVSATAHPIE